MGSSSFGFNVFKYVGSNKELKWSVLFKFLVGFIIWIMEFFRIMCGNE